ncbi:MAG: DciA family protein [Terricaulis sp.]
MSLRDRFRPTSEPAPDPDAETRATHTLSSQRGKASYASAPRAGKAAAAVLKPILPKGCSLGLNEMKRRWSEIAGDTFARATPEKFVGGVLTLRCPGALAPFLQQQIPLLSERLKTAGAKVSSVRIAQGSAAPKLPSNVRRLSRPITAAEESALAQALDPVSDPGLKSALMRLGRAVKQG